MEATATRRAALDAHQRRLVAVTAVCDPRSVLRVLRGEPTRSIVSTRVQRALLELRAAGRLPDDARQDIDGAAR